jgi:hypothetical protein
MISDGPFSGCLAPTWGALHPSPDGAVGEIEVAAVSPMFFPDERTSAITLGLYSTLLSIRLDLLGGAPHDGGVSDPT